MAGHHQLDERLAFFRMDCNMVLGLVVVCSLGASNFFSIAEAIRLLMYDSVVSSCCGLLSFCRAFYFVIATAIQICLFVFLPMALGLLLS